MKFACTVVTVDKPAGIFFFFLGAGDVNACLVALKSSRGLQLSGNDLKKKVFIFGWVEDTQLVDVDQRFFNMPLPCFMVYSVLMDCRRIMEAQLGYENYITDAKKKWGCTRSLFLVHLLVTTKITIVKWSMHVRTEFFFCCCCCWIMTVG